MIKEYKKLLDQARAKQNENKKFFQQLRKDKPKDLDQITNAFHDEAFETIDCLNCANCCRGTGPLLLQKDIDRLAKACSQKPGAFVDAYLRIDEDNDYVFKKMPCPFLQNDNYCSVYEARPNACREFPHTQQRDIYQKLAITQKNTLVCPAVYLITENLKAHYKK